MTAAGAHPAFEIDLVGRITERLRTCLVETDGVLKAALPGLELAEAGPREIPAAVVFLARDVVEESVAPAVGAIQPVTATIAVVVFTRTVNDRRGEDARDPLALAVGAIRRTINGWRPPPPAGSGLRPGALKRATMNLRRGTFAGIDGGRAVWRDEYTVAWWAQTVQQS